MFTLIIEDSDGNIADEYSFEQGEFVIGRSTGSDIILPSDNVSRRHARLFTEGSKCLIEDMGSSNGVFINGKRIHKVTEIPGAAQVKVGDYYLHIEGGTAGGGRAPGGSGDSDEAQEQGPAGAEIFGRLVGTGGPVQGRPFDLTRTVNLVGRGKDCAITVIDPSISRVHAKVLRMEDGSLYVEDLKSSNGTYINDQRVTRGQFNHGDRVRFGNVEFISEMPGVEGDVVEVSSGGRKGLIFLSVFLFLVLAGGVVAAYIFRDKLFGTGVSQEEAKAIIEQREKTREQDRLAELETAQKKLDKIVSTAEKLAAADNWSEAEKMLERGAKEVERVEKLDEKGALAGFFQSHESTLRDDRSDVDAIVEGLAGKEWAQAGKAYEALLKRGGPLLKLGKAKIDEVRDPWLQEAVAAVNVEQNLGKAIDLYSRASALHPTDATLAAEIARLRVLQAAQPPPVPVPVPVPVPGVIPAVVPIPPIAPPPTAPVPGAPAPVP